MKDENRKAMYAKGNNSISSDKIGLKKIISIDTGQKYANPNNRLKMTEEAEDRAIILLRNEKYPIGTTALLMHSGLVKVTMTKTIEDIAGEIKVVMNHNKRRYRKRSSTTHNVIRNIVDMEDELTDRPRKRWI